MLHKMRPGKLCLTLQTNPVMASDSLPKLLFLVVAMNLTIVRQRRLMRKMMFKMTAFVFISLVLVFLTAQLFFDAHYFKPPTTLLEQGSHLGAGRRKFRFQARFHAKGELSQKKHPRYDYSKLMTVLKSPECDTTAQLHILITSSYENVEKRKAIRSTWCSKSKDPTINWQCIFLLGKKSGNHRLSQRLKIEMEQNGDIVQGDYIDSYRNLTIKVLNGFTWARNKCNPQYILKTDDDCFINSWIFTKFLTGPNRHGEKRVYVGNVFLDDRNTQVIRDPQSKWYVPMDAYAPDSYPPYASGTGYLISRDVLQGILELSHFHKPFPNEDAYIGVLVNSLGIEPLKSHRFTFSSEKWSICNFLYLLVVHNVDCQKQQQFYTMAQKALQICDEEEIKTWN